MFSNKEIELLYKGGFKNLSKVPEYALKQLKSPIQRYGRVEYVFRPATSYPARIYAFIDADKWLTRNRLVSGCANIPPFFSRPMNSDELTYYHFSSRLSALQFESWDNFIQSEMWDVNIWNKEVEGFGTKYLKEPMSFESKYAPLLKKAERKNKHSFQLNLFE